MCARAGYPGECAGDILGYPGCARAGYPGVCEGAGCPGGCAGRDILAGVQLRIFWRVAYSVCVLTWKLILDDQSPVRPRIWILI